MIKIKSSKSNKNYQLGKNQGAYVDKIHKELKDAIDCRSKAELLRNGSIVRQDNYLQSINPKIGGHTYRMPKKNWRLERANHRVDRAIGKLCQLNKSNTAMNLAYDYLNKEETRLLVAVARQIRIIKDVERGTHILIDSDGTITTDTTNIRNYFSNSKEQLQKVIRWKAHVSHYLV